MRRLRSWIAECIRKLAETSGPKGVEVWIENHGDFTTAREIAAILLQAASPHIGVVWDPANSFAATRSRLSKEQLLGRAIRHVHIKDLRHMDGWKYVLTGDGDFPLQELLGALENLKYDRFLSFEWEKKWHPEIADAEIALPHFVHWFRKKLIHGCSQETTHVADRRYSIRHGVIGAKQDGTRPRKTGGC